ncbi:MAG: PD-(D/E)XK nuclease family protein [Labilithrix sp.]|nr:PD-(D/E)XK nuclease family protein [Labilithrix sp.]
MLSPRELVVVPAERHVERLAREGHRAETRTSLKSRLTAALLPDVAFADRRECRLFLAMALADAAAPGQLDLFGGAPGPRASDGLLSAVRERGGPSWARTVAAVDDAIGWLRARGATASHLDRVARVRVSAFVATRAKTLAGAMRALDERLARAGARDARLAGAMLAEAIAATGSDALEALLETRTLRARWLLSWEPADLAWWRALDEKLTPRGGGARVVLPMFDKRLEGSRDRDPLEALAEEIARGLDAPAESEIVAAVLGDLSLSATSEPVDGSRVRLLRAGDVVAQARAVVGLVAGALTAGAAVERIVVALPVLDERTLDPLRRALEDERIVSFEARGAPPSRTPVVAAALLALDVATTLERREIARLLRSGFVDPALLGEDGDRRDLERRLARFATTLETTATAAGADAPERLVRTAGADAPLAERLVAIFARVRAAKTRGEHLRAARALWAELGVGARAGRGGLASFTRDEPPLGVPRVERLAIARDARAWDALVTALDLHENTAHRAGALEQAIDHEAFRLELASSIDEAASQPGAGRAAAVRVARLGDVAGDDLDLLVVVDANEGVLPRDDTHDPLVSESLADALARASGGAFVAPAAGSTRARELAALALAAADAKRIVICHAREDPSGAPLAPSPVVSALESAGVPVAAAPIAAAAPALGEAQLSAVARRVAREREREGFFLDPSRPRSDVVGDLRLEPPASALIARETGGGERALAVTGLERFARCAFMGFAHVVLAAREADHAEELPDAREEGTVVHEALAAAFGATRELWPRRPRDEEAILTRGLAAADRVLELWQGHAPLRVVVRLRVSDAVGAVLRAALADEIWDFALAEQAFGGRGAASWPPFVLARDELRLTLRGTIDRVDRAHDGRAHRVVDYKRSKSTVRKASSALGETALQVPLYACEVSRELGLPATGLYTPTQARDVAPDAKPSAKIEQQMEELVRRTDGLAEVERRALDLVARARAGALAPIPADESECRTCAVSGGCRKPRFAMTPEEEGEA